MTKSRAVRILVVLIAIPILGAVAAYFWINAIADRRWAAAQDRIRQLSAAYPEAGSGRTPAVSEASKDNQIHFVAAIRMAAPKEMERADAASLVAQGKRAEALDSVLDDAQDFLDRLHQGARRIARSPADFPPRWPGDWDGSTLTYMMHCGVLRARQQRLRKSPVEAAETLMDLLQLGRFWSISGMPHNRSLAMDFLLPPLEELRDLVSFESLSAQQFQSLDRELEPFDAALRSPILDLEPALARWAETLGQSEVEAKGVWGFVLPARFVKAEAFEFLCRSVEQLQDAHQKGFPEVRSRSRRIYDEGKQTRNPLIRQFAGLGYDLRWTELERKAQVGLLRAAARYRATGEIPNLPDPFGTQFLRNDDGTRMKIWSLGFNGQDDRGEQALGWWTRTAPFPGVSGYLLPKDIVIEVPRRP